MTFLKIRNKNNAKDDPTISKLKGKTSSSSRRVQFQDSGNSIVHYEQGADKEETWYNIADYQDFKRLWKFNQLQIEKTRDVMGLLGLNLHSDTMEAYEMFSRRAGYRRDKLRKIVLQYQDECRSQGKDDPDGASDLSKSVSMHDQGRALKLAEANAQEALEYRREKEEEEVSLGWSKDGPECPSPTSVVSSLLGFNLDMLDPLNCTSALSCANWNFQELEVREITDARHDYSYFDDMYRDSFDELHSAIEALGDHCDDDDDSSDSDESC